MKKMMLLLMVGILLTGMVTWPIAAGACSCAQPAEVKEELSRSDAVFSGKVIQVEEKSAIFLPGTQSAVFQVSQVWKGPSHSQIKIKTGQGGGDCGFDFNEGQEYLVYARNSTMYGPNALSTIMCDRTDVLSQAQSDLPLLGKGEMPTKEVDLVNGIGWLLPLTGFSLFMVIAYAVYGKKKGNHNSR